MGRSLGRSSRCCARSSSRRKPPKSVPYLLALADWLRRERPDGLIACMPQENLAALMARDLAGTRTRVLLTEHNTLSAMVQRARSINYRALPPLIGHAYRRADAVVAVSTGVADDLAATTGLPRRLIDVIHNPAVPPDVDALAAEPVEHPWLQPGEPPVVLGVGRLVPQKGFVTLLRAFAEVRRQRPARLVILGEGPARRPRPSGGPSWRRWRASSTLPAASTSRVTPTIHSPGWPGPACSSCLRPMKVSATCCRKRWPAVARWSAPTARAGRPRSWTKDAGVAWCRWATIRPWPRRSWPRWPNRRARPASPARGGVHRGRGLGPLRAAVAGRSRQAHEAGGPLGKIVLGACAPARRQSSLRTSGIIEPGSDQCQLVGAAEAQGCGRYRGSRHKRSRGLPACGPPFPR